LGGKISDKKSNVDILFPSNCIVDDKGNFHLGNVHVDIVFMNSNNPKHWRAMPNGFRGYLLNSSFDWSSSSS
jgi:hypothetical protein